MNWEFIGEDASRMVVHFKGTDDDGVQWGYISFEALDDVFSANGVIGDVSWRTRHG